VRLFAPLRPNATARLARANPLAKLVAAVVLMGVLFVSLDPLTPLLVLVGLAAAVPFTGLAIGDLVARIRPILLAAFAIGVVNVLLAAEHTGSLLLLGPLVIGSDNILAGAGLALRLLAIALSGVLALATTDPTDLADSLVQQVRVPPRFAVGALAAARLIPIMAVEWQTLALARRARGVSAGRSPLAGVRLAFGRLLAMLVGAVRRGTRLAIDMESRGFGSQPCRSVARPQRTVTGDWVLIAAATTLGLGAIGVSVALDSWRFLFS
jgi:energy-coupling factor transport system permease protein